MKPSSMFKGFSRANTRPDPNGNAAPSKLRPPPGYVQTCRLQTSPQGTTQWPKTPSNTSNTHECTWNIKACRRPVSAVLVPSNVCVCGACRPRQIHVFMRIVLWGLIRLWNNVCTCETNLRPLRLPYFVRNLTIAVCPYFSSAIETKTQRRDGVAFASYRP